MRRRERTIRREVEAAGLASLAATTESGGIRVVLGAAGEAWVQLSVKSRAASAERAEALVEGFAPRIERRGNELQVVAAGRAGKGEKLEVDLTVALPAGCALDLESGAGDLVVEVDAAEVRARSGAGNVRIGRARGPVRVRTGAGGVRVDSLFGAPDLRTGSGDVFVRLDETPDGAGRIETQAGSVRFEVGAGVGLTLSASTGAGEIECDFPLAGSATRRRGAIHDGGPKVSVSSGAGDVVVTGAR